MYEYYKGKNPIMTREEFLVYEDLFNKKDYAGVTSYFSPNCTVEYMDKFSVEEQKPPVVLHGPDEFIKNYKALHANFKEFLDLGIFLSDEKNMIVEFHTEFIAMRDAKFMGGPCRKGEVFAANQFCIYDFDENGKYSRIRISHFRVLSNDSDFKPLHSLDE